MTEDQIIVLVLTDFNKAFDTIDHDLSYGFDKLSVQLIKSFYQGVTLNGDVSNLLLIVREIPQRSILDPILFWIYTSQLSCYIKYSSIYMYADETQLYYFTFSHIEFVK